MRLISALQYEQRFFWLKSKNPAIGEMHTIVGSRFFSELPPPTPSVKSRTHGERPQLLHRPHLVGGGVVVLPQFACDNSRRLAPTKPLPLPGLT